MIAAMFESCVERGAANVTVADVVTNAGVSRRTFYEIFADCEDCLLAAFEEAIARASRRVVPAYRSERRWQDRVRVSLEALLTFLDGDPRMGRFLVVETLSAGPAVLRRRMALLACMVEVVEGGVAKGAAGRAQSSITAEGTVGAVVSVIHAHLLTADGGPLIELVNPLMSIIVLPYLGQAAARRELERPVGAPTKVPRPARSQLGSLGMRLTYRTIQVMAAIAESPGRSNREVGVAAGVADQGQISKLLGRLKRAGLIENTADDDVQGAPNAWRLTDNGEQAWSMIASPRDG
jgi:AcrR family transcriptional regulator/DNA-binding MarR family transcriptional regulator